MSNIMNHQILNIEQMQHLKELGLDTSKASAYWHRVVRMNTGEIVTNWFVSFSEPSPCLATMKVETIPTFTSDDIQSILPKVIKPKDYFYCDTYYLYVDYQYNTVSYSYHIADEGLIEHKAFKIEEYGSLINTLYETLCWCIEQGFVETKKEE